MAFTSRGRALLSLILLSFFNSTLTQSTCGSLVTYRQYSSLLQDAPTCFLQGCGGVNSTSMSAGCPSQAPCSDLWNTLQKQWQGKDWCQTCEDDIACRISGWPVLNASATCDTNPGKWLFGASGDCCASGDEATQLAHWVGTMCSNGSEWRQKFSRSGGMAMDDWKEWILPWNETVSPEDVDPLAEKQPPGCSKTPFYMGVFFIENLIYLLAAVLFGFYRLWWIKRKENKFTSDETQPVEMPHLMWKHDNGSKDALDPSFATKSFLGAYLPLIIGIVLAGSQIGLNMLSALIIQRTPGYSHVNIGHLGLLFCSRPRLTWLTCVLGLARKWIPRKYFSTTISKTAAKATLASVAVSSTISEGILQIVAIYYMAIAANSGRGKGFYAPHHLKPYDRGLDAWNMYVGALMWLIVCVPIIIIWPVVAMFHARIFFLLHKTRIGLWRLLRLPTNGINPYSHNAHPSADDFNEERTFLYVPLNSRDWNEAGRNPPEDWNERPHDSTGFNERGQEPDDWNDPGSGSSPHVRPEMLEAESLIPRTRIRGGGSSMSVRPEDSWQEAGGNYGITPIGSPSASGITSAGTPSSSGVVNRRSPLGRDSGLRGGDSENDVRMYTSLRGGAGDEIDGGRYYQDNYAYDPPGGRRTPSGGAQYQRVRQVSAEQGLQRQSSLRGGGAAWNTDMPAATKFDYYHFQAPIIWLGVVIGLISYAAQWMFWDGFVKASGERFCHPKLLGTAITWAFGSVITGVLPFGLQ